MQFDHYVALVGGTGGGGFTSLTQQRHNCKVFLIALLEILVLTRSPGEFKSGDLSPHSFSWCATADMVVIFEPGKTTMILFTLFSLAREGTLLMRTVNKKAGKIKSVIQVLMIKSRQLLSCHLWFDCCYDNHQKLYQKSEKAWCGGSCL